MGDNYAIVDSNSGMAVDDNTMISVISSSDSEPMQGGRGQGGLLHPPRTHSGRKSPRRELEDTMCLPNHSAEHGSYFPKSCGGLFGPVFLVNCVPRALPGTGCVVSCGPGPAEFPLGDNGVLLETWPQFSDISSDPER